MRVKKKITIEDLAGMVQRGFVEVKKEFKEHIDTVVAEIRTEIKTETSKLNNRSSITERILVQNHEPRIRVIEKDLGIRPVYDVD